MYTKSFFLTMSLVSIVLSTNANIFDSAAEFSGTQGQNSWFYGYYDGDSGVPYTSSDFEEMPEFINGNLWIVHRGDPSGYWTSLGATGGHPNGPIGNYYQATEHWATRRWVSEVSGTLQIEGTLAKSNTQEFGDSDGIIGHIFVNNNNVFSQRIYSGDATGVDYSIQVAVDIGDTIDFAIQPVANDMHDGTRFTATGTVIPEPVSGALFGISAFGLIWIRRRRRIKTWFMFYVPPTSRFNTSW